MTTQPPDPSTPLDPLDAIRARLAKRTPGQWEKRPGDVSGTDRGQPLLKRDGTPIHAVAIRGEHPHTWTWITTACETNVDFIAHAPDDIQTLLGLLATERQQHTEEIVFHNGVSDILTSDLADARTLLASLTEERDAARKDIERFRAELDAYNQKSDTDGLDRRPYDIHGLRFYRGDAVMADRGELELLRASYAHVAEERDALQREIARLSA